MKTTKQQIQEDIENAKAEKESGLLITVYRVEDDEGRGMYRNNKGVGWNMSDYERHPSPSRDEQISEMWDRNEGLLKFGFSSVEQLNFWIYRDKWKIDLHENGFFVSVIRAKGRCGKTQAIYFPHTRIDIKRISLLEI